MPIYTPDPEVTQSAFIPNWIKPYIPAALKFAVGIVILALGWMLSKWAHRALLSVLRKARLEEAHARFISSLGQYTVLAAAIVSSLNQVGIQTTSLVALLASAGLAIGLALQGSLSSFASGVMILFLRPFTLGDSIKVLSHSGDVSDIGLFQTKIRGAEGEIITLPNSTITSQPIINYTHRGIRRATAKIRVAYGSSLDVVHEALKRAISAIEQALAEPEPLIYLSKLNESSIDFEVGVWCQAPDHTATLGDLNQSVYIELEKAGISIPYPQLVLHHSSPTTNETSYPEAQSPGLFQ